MIFDLPINDLQRKVEYIIDKDGCWICTSHSDMNSQGYKRIYPGGKSIMMHRFVFESVNGVKIRSGDVIRHKCDNTRCINPDHLVIGTTEDNIRDRQERNRQAKGECVGNSKLNEDEVMDIFNNSSEKYSDIAKKYGISKRNVLDIKNGRVWGYLTKGLVPGRKIHDYSHLKFLKRGFNGKFIGLNVIGDRYD